MKKRIAMLLCIISAVLMITACGNENKKVNKKEGIDMVLSGSFTKIADVPSQDLSAVTDSYQTAALQKGDIVAILSTNYGDIKMRFFPEVAPLAVNNFIALAKAGKYDNTIFHRVIENFMIQGGDYTNFDGHGGISIYGKGFAFETCDQVKNIRGSVAMAHSSLPESNGSQFYINQVDNAHLDGGYTVFGQVYEGMDVVDTIAGVPKAGSTPLENVILNSVKITTY